MKSKLFTLGSGLVLAVLLTGCCGLIPKQTTITGSGNVVTREEVFTDFDKVEVSHAFTVDISQGDSFRVVVRVDDNLVEYLEVVKQGDTLKIGLEPSPLRNVRNATMEAEVTMPELTGLELSGASDGAVTGFKSSQPLDVKLSGASSLRGDIEAGDARFDLSGASSVTLSGSAKDVTIGASGASVIDLADFPVADAGVEASGASTATVNPSGSLDVGASGASHVYYVGNPTMGKIDTSGASSVERK
jgi:hypothetical protein